MKREGPDDDGEAAEEQPPAQQEPMTSELGADMRRAVGPI
jgi:hypothetical protein